MLITNENNDELILRDVPFIPVFLGLLAAVYGLYMAYDFYALAAQSSAAADSSNVAFIGVFFLAMIGGGIFFALRAAMTTIVINRRTKSLTVEKRRVIGTERRDFSFGEIKGYISIKTHTRKNTTYYLPQLEIISGEMIDLIHSPTTRRDPLYRAVNLGNSYLSRPREKNTFAITLLEG